MLKVSTIIPHAGGWELLHQCLSSLYESKDVELETIIVENGSFERISPDQVSQFPNLKILHFRDKLGFAAACNRGIEAATGSLIFLLNNDAVVEPETLYFLCKVFEGDNKVAACQPKILSLRDKKKFDYSSACGGEIDIFGYPFARGRIFDTVECDQGQYDHAKIVFWGAGAALMMRKEIYLEAGGLAEPFFAHMEEIDLQWRFHLMGYEVRVEPRAVAYHLGAATIGKGSALKLYLNHRNNLAMLFRNCAFSTLVWLLPARLLFEFTTFVISIIQLDFKRTVAVVRASLWFLVSLPYLIKTHSRVQKLRRVSDSEIFGKLYRGSIVWQYFIRHRWKYAELPYIG